MSALFGSEQILDEAYVVEIADEFRVLVKHCLLGRAEFWLILVCMSSGFK